MKGNRDHAILINWNAVAQRGDKLDPRRGLASDQIELSILKLPNEAPKDDPPAFIQRDFEADIPLDPSRALPI